MVKVLSFPLIGHCVYTGFGFMTLHQKPLYHGCTFILHIQESILNPLTPRSDQDIIFPYNIKILSSRQVMRVKTNLN